MARLSPVNLPGANWSDLGTDYDPLAIEQGFQKIRANEIELQHAEETIRQQNALKAAQVRDLTSKTDALTEETRQKKALFEAGISSAKVDSGILADMNLDDLPPDLAREAAELRKLVEGAKGEADWLMLGGRISSLRQRIGHTNASSNLADMIGRTQALGQQLGLSDTDEMLEAITALEHNRFTSQQPIDPITGKATTGRAKGGMTIPEAQAAIATELQHRQQRLRNIETRQMYQTNMESMTADMTLIMSKARNAGGQTDPAVQALIDQYW